MKRDRLLNFARIILLGLLGLNIASAIAFLCVTVVSLVPGNFLHMMLLTKYGAAAAVGEMMNGIRVIALLAAVAAVPFHLILVNLLAIIASVGEGDPFRSRNAARIANIAWAMLVMQGLDLCVGAAFFWIHSTGADVATWSPSIGGWVAVLLLFVLARVFRVGAQMRDDLEGTV